MTPQTVAPLREYTTLEDFINGQNNFYLHFLEDHPLAGAYRDTSHFRRFQEQNPEMELDITRATVQARRAQPEQRLPYEKLWDAYKIMSKLVFVDDQYVMRDGQPNSYFLCQ